MAHPELSNGFNVLHSGFEAFRSRAENTVLDSSIRVQERKGAPYMFAGVVFTEHEGVTLPFVFQATVRLSGSQDVTIDQNGFRIRFKSDLFHYDLIHPLEFTTIVGTQPFTADEKVAMLKSIGCDIDMNNAPETEKLFLEAFSSPEVEGEYSKRRELFRNEPQKKSEYYRCIDYAVRDGSSGKKEFTVLGKKNMLVISLGDGEEKDTFAAIEH